MSHMWTKTASKILTKADFGGIYTDIPPVATPLNEIWTFPKGNAHQLLSITMGGEKDITNRCIGLTEAIGPIYYPKLTLPSVLFTVYYTVIMCDYSKN